MKQQEEPNKLCLSCRRGCKQPATVVIADCRRYYQGWKGKREVWKQQDLPLK